jgi:anti-sigma B factor antagonist
MNDARAGTGPALSWEIAGADHAPVVALHGEIDLSTSPLLRATLVSLIDGGARELTVDMSEVTFVDSTGLGVLVGALQLLQSHGGDGLSVRGVGPVVRRVFELTGLDAVFSIPPG